MCVLVTDPNIWSIGSNGAWQAARILQTETTRTAVTLGCLQSCCQYYGETFLDTWYAYHWVSIVIDSCLAIVLLSVLALQAVPTRLTVWTVQESVCVMTRNMHTAIGLTQVWHVHFEVDNAAAWSTGLGGLAKILLWVSVVGNWNSTLWDCVLHKFGMPLAFWIKTNNNGFETLVKKIGIMTLAINKMHDFPSTRPVPSTGSNPIY